MVECRTPEREVRGSKPTAAVLCHWARHFTPRKYWLITQEAMAPSRHDWKIVDWDVKPQHNQPTKTSMSLTNCYRSLHCEGTQIHCGYVLMSSPENGYETWRYICAVDVTIYHTYIDKTFAQTCRYPGEILQLLQSCREYCPVRIVQTYI